MAVITVKEYAQNMKKLAENYWPTVIRGVESAGMRGTKLLLDRSHATAFDIGTYAHSWQYSIESGRSYIKIAFFNLASYAGVIEKGRRVGARMPPVKALLPWVTSKLGASPKDAPGIALAVARAIKARGIKGKFILRDANMDLKRIIDEEITYEIKRAVASAR